MKRLLLQVEGEPDSLRVEGPRFHYLVHVLRANEGETLEVFDGEGRAFTAKVASIEADAAQLTLGAARVVPRGREWILLQGLPKGDKLELILQKTTELGVTRVAPVTMERSVVKLSADKAAERLPRWTRIVEEAARQSGRSDVPSVEPLRSLDKALDALPEGCLVLVLDEEQRSVRLGDAFAQQVAPGRAVALVIGPEGGISRTELERIQSRGGASVTLGARILRTETAGLAALTVLQHLDGALG